MSLVGDRDPLVPIAGFMALDHWDKRRACLGERQKSMTSLNVQREGVRYLFSKTKKEPDPGQSVPPGDLFLPLALLPARSRGRA